MVLLVSLDTHCVDFAELDGLGETEQSGYQRKGLLLDSDDIMLQKSSAFSHIFLKRHL